METPGTYRSPPMETDGQDGTTESAKLKRKRQARGTACEGCAHLKMKCVAQENGKCERCERVGRECIPKTRKRQTLDGAQPSSVPRTNTASIAPSLQYDLPSANRQPAHQADTSALLLRHDLTYTGSKTFVSLLAQGVGNASVCEELLKGVDYNFVANCFTIFRQLTPYFPFVELSPAADVVQMVGRRPAFVLAICTVASASRPAIQDRLSKAFLYCLSSKVILSSECSLDLLLGLLVYLAWQHHYLEQQQTYQKLCLLAGIAGDLGIYKSNFEAMEDFGSTLERDRAFIGCYSLCSALCATGYDKPNPLRWTDNLSRAAKNAGLVGTLLSDRDLVASLEMMRALNDLSVVFHEHDGEPPASSAQFMELHTRTSVHRLKALKREHLSLAGSLGYAAANLHIYQRLLRSSPAPDSSVLIQCACAVKEYTDDILARPASTLHQMTIIDWTSFLEILLLMAKVSKPSTSGWEAGALTSMLQPEAVLDSLYSHMASTPANDPLSLRHEGLMQRFQAICKGIKRHFLVDGEYDRNGSISFDALDCFGDGVLDPRFWNDLTSGL